MNQADPTKIEAEPCAPAKKIKSKGEKLFDWGVYGGIAGVGTFVATVPIAYLFKYTKAGGKYYQGAVNALHAGAERIAPGVLSKSLAENVVMTTTLMMGGNAMLYPVGEAEKNKVKIVSGLNTMLDDHTPPSTIEEEPKQTWGSLLKARGAAWLSVFATLSVAGSLFPKAFQTFEDEFAERICQVFRKPTQVVEAGKHVPSRTYLLGKISAIDVFATAAAATLLYAGGHMFARKREEKKQYRQQGYNGPVHPHADEVSADVAAIKDAPQPTLVGERAHDGKAMEQSPSLVAQL